MVVADEIVKLQALLDEYTSANALIAKARVSGDPAELKTLLAGLTPPSEDDPNYTLKVAINAILTDKYNTAIAEIEGYATTPFPATVNVTAPNATTVSQALDDAAKDRDTTITANVNTDAVDDLEARLAKIKADTEEFVKNRIKIIENGEEGATSQPYVDKDQNDVSLALADRDENDVKAEIDDLAEFATQEWQGTGVGKDGLPVEITPPEEAPDKVREVFKKLTEDLLASQITEFGSEESWGNYLQEQIDKLESSRKLLESLGMSPTSGDKGKLDAYQEALDKLKPPELESDLNIDDSGVPEQINKVIQFIASKTATLRVKIKEVFEGGYARGTKKAKKGVALTGEKGVETVLDDNGFYTVGHDGPELVNLKGGEEILTHEETKKLFGGKKKRVSGQAFEDGTPFWQKLVNGFVSGAKKLASAAKDTAGKITVSMSGDAPGGSNNNKGGGKKRSTYKEEDLVDWIPTLLERLRKQTDKIIEQSESLVNYTAQNVKLDDAIKSNTDAIGANNSAYARYIQQAEKVSQSGGLSADIIDKIKNGVVDIQVYDENTRKVISDYQKWYDLAQGTLDTVSELNKEQKELAVQKLDNVQQYYENRIGAYANNVDLAQSAISLGQATGRETRATDYDGIFSDLQQQLRILREERAVYEETFNALVSSGVVEQGSKEWFEYTGNINSMDKAIIDASISLDDFSDIAAEIPVKNLDVAIKYLNTVQSTLESVQGLREAQGSALEALDYEKLISVGIQQIETLEAQNEVLKTQQNGLDIMSDEYQEIQDKINGNLTSVWDIKTTQEGWNDAIIDLDIERLQEVNDKYNNQLKIMEAIEGLEKARQRRSLIFRDGAGFVYEANQDDVRAAQREYDDVMFGNLIDTLEGLKKDDNVYDSTGNLIGQQFAGLDGINLQPYLSSVVSGAENSSLLSGILGGIDPGKIAKTAANSNSVAFNGDIVLQGVSDVEGFAEALRLQLPSYISQLWFSNN
jgi:flagellar biosynthesis chaperone FliJ